MALKMTSPYRGGADKGLIMGVYLSLMFWGLSESILAVISPDVAAGSAASMVGLALVICMPLVLYLLLRYAYVKDGGMSTFAKLWMEGIMTYVFGGLIAVVAGYVYMRFVNPSFLGDVYSALPALMEQASKGMSKEDAAQYHELAKAFEEMRATGQLPSAISFLLNMLWYIVFLGSILSLAIAALARIGKVNRGRE